MPNHHPVKLNAFQIMPNHVHGIIIIKDTNVGIQGQKRAGLRPAPTRNHALSEIVGAFKSFSARRINESRKSQGNPVWQRNYYEHIIRNENELNAVRKYIKLNVYNWQSDVENPFLLH